MEKQKQVTKEQAIALNDNKFYEGLTAKEIVEFQLFRDKLCMPFPVFHKAMEEALGRSIWTHEFAGQEALQKEFLKERPAPTFEEILNLIPAEKRIIIQAE